MASLATQARHHGARTLIVNGNLLADRHLAQRLKAFGPNVIAVSTYFNRDCHRQTKAVIDAFRGKALIVVGGYDATTNPLVTQELKPDILVTGEGEIALAELTKADFVPARLDRRELIVTQRDGATIVQAKRPFDLDTMPLADELIDVYTDREKLTEATINVARGCYGRCTFCIGEGSAVTYMTPTRVLEQIDSWLPRVYRNAVINLVAPDVTAQPRTANEIVRLLNQHQEMHGRKFHMAVRVDTLFRALQLAFANGQSALAAWEKFLSNNDVEIEVGVETLSLNKLRTGHYNKTKQPEKYYERFLYLLELGKRTNTKIGVDLIVFDPETTLEDIAYDYRILHQLSKKYPNMIIYPDAIFRELILYPGTESVSLFGLPGFSLQPGQKAIPKRHYQDKRVAALLSALRIGRGEFGIRPNRKPVSRLKNLHAITQYVLQRYPDPTQKLAVSAIEEQMEFLLKNPWLSPR